MRLLCIDNGGFMLDFVMRCIDDGHKVKWFIRRTEKTKDIGKGLAEFVDRWQDWMRWADLVVLPDNTKYLHEIDAWRKNHGTLVVGATVEAATWELDRNEGQRVFKKAGIPVPSYKEFNNYDQAIAYVKKAGKRFVSKPCGDEPDKSLSYVAKSPADMVYMLERWKKAKKHKGAFIMQDFIGGTEMAVGAWFGPHGFNEGWCENWEFKKLHAGEKGPACYDSETEVLTHGGWKPWPKVTMKDKLATLVDGELCYEQPSQVVHAPFKGEMLHWTSKKLDVMVTPGHGMYVLDRQDERAGRADFKHVPADTVAADPRDRGYSVGRTASWRGLDNGFDAAYARLLGMVMADGYARERSIVFGNCPAHKEVLIRDAAAACGLLAPRYGPDVYINSRAWADELHVYGKAHEKRVPAKIKSAAVNTIRAFLDGYALDASVRETNQIYTTASEGMADDLQELALRAGWVASINRRDRRKEPVRQIKGYEIRGTLSWDVSICKTKPLARLRQQDLSLVPYDGFVHCATVSSHVLFIRRKGKPLWCGNTGEMGTVLRYVSKSKLANKVLKPLEDALHRLGYCGYVDVNCIIDDEGNPWPLEFTMRKGWPTFNIQQALLKGDTAEWLAALAQGQDVKPFSLSSVALGVVMAIPDFPYSQFTRKEVTGIPVYGLKPSILDNVHPCELMSGTAPHDVNGKVVTMPCLVTAGDYVLVASGVGSTISEAKRRAYRVVDKIEIPNSPLWRTDIGDRLKKQLPKIQSQGYATDLVF